MTLQQFAETFHCKACYIAIMPSSEEWVYDLEVEVSYDSIGGVYRTDCRTNKIGLRKVRKLADELDRILTGMGVTVFKTREEWEEFDVEEICRDVFENVDKLRAKDKEIEMQRESVDKMLKPVGTKRL